MAAFIFKLINDSQEKIQEKILRYLVERFLGKYLPKDPELNKISFKSKIGWQTCLEINSVEFDAQVCIFYIS